MTQPPGLQRRRFVSCLLAATAGLVVRRVPAGPDETAAARSAHFPFGDVVPRRPIPAWQVTTHTGASSSLAALVRGRSSALQLMFTGCSATCPIQGALFEQAQHQLPQSGDFQLLSISIAPLVDTPQALTLWLREFSAGPSWLGLRPRTEDLEQIYEVLTRGAERRPTGPDPHTGQVYIVNRRGELVYRTPSMPPAAQIVEVLKYAAA